jgi:hypothetical protein
MLLISQNRRIHASHFENNKENSIQMDQPLLEKWQLLTSSLAIITKYSDVILTSV